MSKTFRYTPKVVKQMSEVFKRKSGPHIRPISRTKEREMWEREWKEEMNGNPE